MRARLQQFLLFGMILITTGFSEPSFLLRRATPTVDTDVPNTITSTTAISGGLNVTDGGGNVTRKGVVYDLASNPIPDISDSFTDEGTGTGDYISSITGLTAETEYRVRAYVENDDPDIGYGLPETFWTLSTQPTGAVNAMATTVNAVSIDLSFEDLMNLTDADGYFILRSTVATPTLVNGQLPGGDLIHTETNTGVTTFNDTGLDPNTTYYYLIAPFNFNGTDTETYHYQITGNDVSATTDPPSNASTLVAAGNEAGNMAYINFQSGNINSTAQGVRVWSITITDAGGADDDGLPTIIDDITFIEGPSNSADFSGTLRAIALFEGATEIGDGSFSGDNLVFTGLNFVVPQSGSRTLDLYVSFDNTVTDGQQLHIEVGSVGLGSPSSTGTLGTVQSTHTAGVTNRVDVVASALEFQSPPSSAIDETDFSLTVRAVDGFGNLDIDNTASVTLGTSPDAISSVTGLTQSLSNGVFTWSDVQIDVTAPSTNSVTASATGLTNTNTSIDVLVPGVIVTPPATLDFCSQNQLLSLGAIVITEGVSDDFGQEPPNRQQVYTIRVPSGYIFSNTSSPNVTTTGGDVSGITNLNIFGSSRKFQFEYDITGTSNIDQITITGLNVRKTGSDQLTNLTIERTASTLDGSSPPEVEAIMNANGVNVQDHGFINFGGVDNATLQQVGGSVSFCPSEPVIFEATGGDNYEFFITPDGGSPISQQDSSANIFVTAELQDLDVVSVIVTNTTTGCDANISLPPLTAEEEPVASIVQPVDGDTIILGGSPIPLVAEDLVGGSTTTNGGVFIGNGVQTEGGNDFTFNPVFGGPTQIVYLFTSTAGCTASDTITVIVQDFGPGIVDNLDPQYCIDDGPVLLNVSINNLEVCDMQLLDSDNNPITGITGSTGTGFTFNPSTVSTVGLKKVEVSYVNNAEQTIIGYTYVQQCTIEIRPINLGFPFGIVYIPVEVCRIVANPQFGPKTCANSSPYEFLQETVIFDAPDVQFDEPFNTFYCEGDVIVADANLGDGEYTFSGPGVQGGQIFRTANSLGRATIDFTTDGIGPGVTSVSYRVTDPINGGCENTIFTSFEVLPTPPAATDFNVPDSIFFCIGDTIDFLTGVSNDPGQYTLLWFEELSAQVELSDYENLLDDPTNPNLQLDTGLVYDISSIDNQVSSVNTFYVANAHRILPYCEGPRKAVVVTVGVIPEADFQVTGLCNSDATQFQDLSTISQGTIDGWLWDFGDGNMSTDQNPTHNYPGPGTYTVSLTAFSERNCDDVITRDITIFPEITANDYPYLELFTTGTNGWTNKSFEEGGVLAPNSWQLQPPDGTKIEVLDGNSWVTNNGSLTYNFNEESWVECPCLDLAALERPMVAFDIWTDTELGVDGAVLQITTDDGLNWYEVGDDQSGVNWYDARGLPGNPGQQSTPQQIKSNFGWTGPFQSWRSAKYSLSQYLDSLDANSRVRLRLAFGSNSSNPGQTDFGGIAFDNFFIGNRNRVVLIEHFTNQNSIDYAAENTEYNDFVNARPNELINIRYHTDFPDPDDLFLSNPSIPGARSLFYGISEISNNAIDGLFNPDPLSDWGDNFYQERTLDAAPYQIEFGFNPSPGEELEVQVEISTDQTVAAREDTFDLYVAIVETFPDMTNVVRQMMPDVSGTRVNWSAQDTVRTFDFSQKLTNIDNTANLSVVAFLQAVNIQEADPKEILQAADSIPPIVPSIVTGIDDGIFGDLNVSLYPNPTQGILNVSFSEPLSKNTQWEVYNTFGQLAASGEFARGSTLVVLPESNFAQGVYLLKLQTADNSFLIRKFMVVR